MNQNSDEEYLDDEEYQSAILQSLNDSHVDYMNIKDSNISDLNINNEEHLMSIIKDIEDLNSTIIDIEKYGGIGSNAINKLITKCYKISEELKLLTPKIPTYQLMIEEYSNTNSQCNHSLFKLLNDIYLKEQQFEQDKILKIQQELEFEDNLILDTKKEEKDYIDKILIQSLQEIKEKELSEYKSKFENIHNKIDDQLVNLPIIAMTTKWDLIIIP